MRRRLREVAPPGRGEGDRQPIAQREGTGTLVYGATMDDLGDHRPGMKAAAEHGVRAPLIEAELWKAEIRDLSRELGLPTCLGATGIDRDALDGPLVDHVVAEGAARGNITPVDADGVRRILTASW